MYYYTGFRAGEAADPACQGGKPPDRRYAGASHAEPDFYNKPDADYIFPAAGYTGGAVWRRYGNPIEIIMKEEGRFFMIHPSYSELMRVVNDTTVSGDEPLINSRYSIVIATAKRARQLIHGDEPLIEHTPGQKPLSVAVQELYEGKVKIIGEDDTAAEVGDRGL